MPHQQPPMNPVLAPWIISAWPTVRNTTLQHFTTTSHTPTLRQIILFTQTLVATYSGSQSDRTAREAFVSRMAPTLLHSIISTRIGRQPSSHGILSRSRQLAVDDSLIIIDRLIREMTVMVNRYFNGRHEIMAIDHPEPMANIQPEQFWEAVSTIIHARAAELGSDSLYVTVRHPNSTPRQLRAPGLSGHGSTRLSADHITADYLQSKLIDLFNSRTGEQLGIDFLSDITIEVDFFNLNQNHLRIPMQQLPGAAPKGGIPPELQYLRGLQELSREGGYCALKPLVVSLDIDACATRNVESEIANAKCASELLRRARNLANELGVKPTDQNGTFGTEVFERFVEHYPAWRVVVVDVYGNVIRDAQGVWIGLEFELPEQPPDKYEWGKTIFLCYDYGNKLRTAHYYRILPRSFGPFGVIPMGEKIRTAGGVKTFRAICPECLERFPSSQRSKHICEHGLRHRCDDCGWTMFRDELAEHLLVDDEHPAELCERCGNEFSQRCIARHRNRCIGLIPRCAVCNHIYTADDPEEEHLSCDRRFHCLNRYCEFYRKKKMDEFDLQHHRCYIEPKKEQDGRKKRGKKRKNNGDDKENELPELVDASADDDDGGLECVWAWDCESVAVYEEVMLNGHSRMQAKQQICLIVTRCLGTNEEHIYDDAQHCIEQFLEWAILQPTGGRGKKRLWSHNGGRYDTRLLFDYVSVHRSELLIASQTIFVGSKIFKFELTGCSFLDSYNHLTMPLKDIPAAFGLDSAEIALQLGIPSLKKGEFPYTFSTPEHRDYVGRLPALAWYEPERRKQRDPYNPKDDDEVGVREWHAAESARIDAEIAAGGEGWNLRKEELEYCRMDVLILAEGLKKWRAINLEKGNCDPLLSMTLAAHAHNTFLTKHLKPNSIPVLKAQSRLAQSNFQQYAWADEDTLARPGYKGGRVGPTCLLYELTADQVREGWSIDMYDFRSEYPSQMWDQPYPIGDYQYHAYAAFEPMDEVLERIQKEDGMISCEIEFPADKEPLFHPYLHSLVNGKLTFALKESTVINRDYIYPSSGRPRSPDDQRFIGPAIGPESEFYGKVNPRHYIEHFTARLNGTCTFGDACKVCCLFRSRAPPTYTIFEVREALKLGYVLHHVYWTLSTPKTSRDLFKSFLRPNYELKLQYSGVPKFINWEDKEEVDEFIKHHADMGILITPKEGSDDYRTWFDKNPALKMCGKLMMNSQYGKFGENSRKIVTAFVDNVDDEEALMNNDGLKNVVVGRAFYPNAAEYRIDTKAPNETVGHTNVIIAAYVTAYGRHLLFQQLHRFKDRVLYYDTDSIVLVNPPNAPRPVEGPFLGDLEHELKNAHAFVSTGAKTYAIKRWVKANEQVYKMLGFSLDDLKMMGDDERDELIAMFGEGSVRWNGEELEYEHVKQKNKGISLNSNVSRILNYALMRKMAQRIAGALEGEDATFVVPKVEQKVFQWKRDAHEFFVFFNEKRVDVEAGSLKGAIAGNVIAEAPCRYTIMPFGWERFKGKWKFERNVSYDDAMVM